LSKSEVAKLAATGYLEESTQFPCKTFSYALESVEGINELSASMETDKIIMQVPASFVKDWVVNDVVGINSNQPLTANSSLFLLLEKDFVCLDETTEDQGDNYENPNKSC